MKVIIIDGSHNKCKINMMINVLEIHRHDLAVVNAVVICDQFYMMRRQDGTFLPQQSFLIIYGYLHTTLSGLVIFFQKN